MIAAILALTTTIETITPRLGSPVGNAPKWFNSSDQKPSREGGAVRFKVLFSPDGVPKKCVIEATTGNAEAETAACEIIKKRFRYEPSINANGTTAYRVLVSSVAFGSKTPAGVQAPAMFSISVKGFEDIQRLRLVVDVGEDGAILGCAPSVVSDEIRAPLARAVCQSISSMWARLIETDENGRAVRYVRDVVVEITHAS